MCRILKRNEQTHKKENHRDPKGNVVGTSRVREDSTSTRLVVANEVSNNLSQTNFLADGSCLSSSMTTSYDTNPMSLYSTTIMETDPEKIWISPDFILDSSKVWRIGSAKQWLICIVDVFEFIYLLISCRTILKWKELCLYAFLSSSILVRQRLGSHTSTPKCLRVHRTRITQPTLSLKTILNT